MGKRTRASKVETKPWDIGRESKTKIDIDSLECDFDFGGECKYSKVFKRDLARIIYAWSAKNVDVVDEELADNDIDRINSWLFKGKEDRESFYKRWLSKYDRDEIEFGSEGISKNDELTLKIVKFLAKCYWKGSSVDNEDVKIKKIDEIEALRKEVEKEITEETKKNIDEYYGRLFDFCENIDKYYLLVLNKAELVKWRDKTNDYCYELNPYGQYIGAYSDYMKMACAYINLKEKSPLVNRISDCRFCYAVENPSFPATVTERLPGIKNVGQRILFIDIIAWLRAKEQMCEEYKKDVFAEFYVTLRRKSIEVMLETRKEASRRIKEYLQVLSEKGLDLSEEKDVKRFNELNKIYDQLMLDTREIEIDTKNGCFINEEKRLLTPYKDLIRYAFMNERNEKTQRALKYFSLFYDSDNGMVKVSIKECVILLRLIYCMMQIGKDASKDFGKRFFNMLKKEVKDKDVPVNVQEVEPYMIYDVKYVVGSILKFLLPIIAAPKAECFSDAFLSLYNNATKIVEGTSEYTRDNLYVYYFLNETREEIEAYLNTIE